MKTCLLLLLALCATAWAGDFARRCADKDAIERVYYQHRTGTKPAFEETLPPALLEKLVRQDLQRESVLREYYGVTISPALLDAEVRRINATTRAPEMLTEIKAALGSDPVKFAQAFAKPILVERLLRDKFENDDVLHAPQRREAERMRNELLAAKQTTARSRGSRGNEVLTEDEESAIGNRQSALEQSRLTSAPTNALVQQLLAVLKQSHSNEMTETTWQMGTRPADTNAPGADEIEIKKRFGPNAQVLSSPHTAPEREEKFYFEDLPGELQNVLRVQLRQRGDVSAVIEMPGGFLVYVCIEKTSEELKVASLSLPKRSYEQWLAEQNGDKR